MEIDAGLVGRKLTPIDREVEWRDTMNYAAAVGDMNPRYFDDLRDGGVLAPPLFAVALTWPMLREVPAQLGDSLPTGALATMVHASEHLTLHRPIRPGDRLRLTGEVAAVKPTSAGTLLVTRIEAQGTGGEKVFTELSGAMFRGIPCNEPAPGSETLPVLSSAAEPGPPAWSTYIAIERRAPHLYDGCTGIVFPIHTSVAFARGVGLLDIVLQGTATLAMAAREIVDREADGDPHGLVEIACRFSGTVVPGGQVQMEFGRLVDDAASFRVLDPDGQPLLDRGYARVRTSPRSRT